MSRQPERVLALVGLVLMTVGWTGFVTTIPLSELEGINNDAEGLSVILVWLQGVVLIVMAAVLAVARRHAGADEIDAVRWPWTPLPTAVGLLILVVVAVMLGPLFVLPLLVIAAAIAIVRGHRGDPRAGGAGSPPWLQVTVLVVMVLAGAYGVVFGAPGIVAYSVELLVASAGLVQPAGVTRPPSPELSLWSAFTVLTVCWAVLLLSYMVVWRRRRAGVGAVAA